MNMDAALWIEIGKVAVAVLSTLGVVATLIGYVWRYVRRKEEEAKAARDEADVLRDEKSQLSLDLHKCRFELEQERKTTKELEVRIDKLNAAHATNLADWKKGVRKEWNKRLNRHKAAVAERDGRLRLLEGELVEKKLHIENLGSQIDGLNIQLAVLRTAVDDRDAELKIAKSTIEHLRETENTLTQQLEDAQIESAESLRKTEKERDEAREKLRAAEARIETLLTWDGRLWNRRLPADATKFRPLKNRKMPIISVLNFKGGVGKTSLTVNLAGLLGRQGKRILMVDLDYQRSLSQLVLSHADRKMLQLERRCLQHFLAEPPHDASRLVEMAKPVENGVDHCSIIINSQAGDIHRRDDSLEETENQLMAEWIIKRDSMPDVRLRLREGLHGIGIESHFDGVFLDCPPRITTSTINGLAASDFVLVPVVLDELSASSVGPLIASLRSLREQFPDLRLLGVVATQVNMRLNKPVQREQAVLDDLKLQCETFFQDYPVRVFDAVVPLNNNAFGVTSGNGKPRLAIDDEGIFGVFDELWKEIAKEMEESWTFAF
jgi:cellulose biosynthesis protein BcsQ